MQKFVSLPNKTLFLEFFIREYFIYSQSDLNGSKMPDDANFYTGISKATLLNSSLKPSILGYQDGRPFLTENISDDRIKKIIRPNTNLIAAVSSEYVDSNNVWHKREPYVISNKTPLEDKLSDFSFVNFKTISPYQFSVTGINENESIFTQFPRNGVILEIRKSETLCFLCIRMPRNDGEWFTHGVYLVMFIKNYGLFDQIELCTQDAINKMDGANLCLEQYKIRDFRKSSLNFELG